MKETTQCKLGAYFYARNKYAQEKWPLGGGIVLYFNFLLTFFPTLTRNMPLLPQFKIVVSNFVVLLLLWNMNQSHLIGQETATVSSLPDGESFVPPGQDSRHPLRCLVPFPNFRPSHRSPEPSVPTAKRHSGVTFPQTPLWPFWHYFMLTHLVWSLFLQEFLSFWRAGKGSRLVSALFLP